MKNIAEIVNLSKEELQKELLISDYMIEYYEEIKKEVVKRSLSGENFDGYKLKSRSSSRKISDDSLLLQLAKNFNIKIEDLYELTLLSPTKLNKKFKENKEFLEGIEGILSESITSYYLVKEKGDRSEKEN